MTETAKLIRINDNGVRCLGVLVWGQFKLYTVERPWLDNKPFESCIPTGTYDLEWITRPSGKPAIQVMDVPGRTHILLHPGNDVQDVVGCIAPGMLPYQDGVYQSRKAMEFLLGSNKIKKLEIC